MGAASFKSNKITSNEKTMSARGTLEKLVFFLCSKKGALVVELIIICIEKRAKELFVLKGFGECIEERVVCDRKLKHDIIIRAHAARGTCLASTKKNGLVFGESITKKHMFMSRGECVTVFFISTEFMEI